MEKRFFMPALVISAVIVWLVACGLMTWVHFAYDGAVSVNPVYWWVYGGAILLIGALSENDAPKQETDRNPRWESVLLLLLATALIYLLVDQCSNLTQFLLYYLPFWWLALMLLLALGITAYQRSRFRRPMRPRRPHTSLFNTSVFLLVEFAPVLLVTLIYLAVVHPVTVDEITPIGEAEGGRFIGRIDGDRTQPPLGLYFFADGDHWYYYDVLTGVPAAYDDPYHPD